MVDLSTHQRLVSTMKDAPGSMTPEMMYWELRNEQNVLPLEMTYSHVSCEEVTRNYWTGVVRDWARVNYMMDRDTMRMQINN